MALPKSDQQCPPNGGQRLPHQLAFDSQTYQKPNRPRPTDMLPETTGTLRNKHLSIAVETATPRLSKRASRFGLAGLFGRSKANLLEDPREKLGIQLEESGHAEGPVPGDTAASYVNGRVSPSLEFSALPEIESPMRHSISKAALRSKPSFKRENSAGKQIPWSPPPLFQAYPQAVKHAALHTPNLSAETILRLQRERDVETNQRSDSYMLSLNAGKTPKEKKSKKSRTTDVLLKSNWSEKVFILVTSGYVLRYAGDGSFDRLPEKIMPLSKDSAAFASDAIPGKPYVLQISQVSDDEGRLDIEASKSMFKKLGLKIESKRSTSCFFLVLENPEEMSSWLVTVRKEIEAMGGKEYRPDEFRRPTSRDTTPQLQSRPSQRYLVNRDPNRFSGMPREPPSEGLHHDKVRANEEYRIKLNFNQCPEKDHDLISNESLSESVNTNQRSTLATEPTPAVTNRHSLITQTSIESRSASNTAASINQLYLEGLRESPRQSYASTSAKTVATSNNSSPCPSLAGFPPNNQDRTAHSNDNQPSVSASSGIPRNSIVPGPSSVIQEMIEVRSGPRSFQLGSVPAKQDRRTPSPATPNFSVPTFSKRYSSTASSPSLSTPKVMAQSPPITLLREPPSPPMIPEEIGVVMKDAAPIEALQHLRISATPPMSSASVLGALPTPPQSSGSHDPRSASDGDRPYSRRLSSLQYSKGISPIQLPTQALAPHPPPIIALPALPAGDRPSRASLLPPLKTTLPAQITKPSTRYSMLPPPKKALTTPLTIRPSSSSSAAPLKATPLNSSLAQETTGGPEYAGFMQSRKLRRPISVHVRENPAPEQPEPLPTQALEARKKDASPLRIQLPRSGTASKSVFDAEGLTPPVDAPSPPKPTRKPPIPPPLVHHQAQSQIRKSTPRVGREPPPVSPPIRSKISITSPAESYFDSAAPHPFIPPIKVSERKFRGSLDGPWNADYGFAPQRNFLDLNIQT
ncbi:hypothetical protein N7G274_009215 [Stereocaulon virgatum]|uniref:PH domain-containing protein n=1 Tax=Stereocaulon virgatum TaxID=373712 RepID=A0ABR3ZYX2_9LECA